MFESLTRDRRETGRLAKPALSFAIHAGLVALVLSGKPAVTSLTVGPVPLPTVIYVPDGPRPRGQLDGEDVGLLPGPLCQCPIGPLPPIDLDITPGTMVGPFSPGDLTRFVTRVPGGTVLAGDSVPGVFRESDLSDSPQVVHFPEPVYPPMLKTAGVQGSVGVTYVIDVNGRVEPGTITIVSSEHAAMAESVRASLVQAVFRAGKIRGKSARTLVRQTIRFSLISL